MLTLPPLPTEAGGDHGPREQVESTFQIFSQFLSSQHMCWKDCKLFSKVLPDRGLTVSSHLTLLSIFMTLLHPDSMQGFGRHPRVGITTSQTCFLFAFKPRHSWPPICMRWGLLWRLGGKYSACRTEATGDMGSIPGSGRSPGEDMPPHSSVLDWRIPWTEEPGGLQSMRLQRVGHDWSYLTCVHMCDDMLLSKRDRVGGQVYTASLPWASICPQWDSDIHQQFAVGIVWWWRARIPGFKSPFCFSLAG